MMQIILEDTKNQLPNMQIEAVLLALAERPVTADELAGFVDAMRAAAVTLPFTDDERAALVDTCGTGGDSSGTFNISTAVALVAAAAGAKIAKHGNRSLTSRCGSADVLDALGVPTSLAPAQAVECLRATGFAFLFAPLMHPAMRRVQPIRRSIGRRTVFNILGPLTNPAFAPAQILGVYAADLIPLMAEAMVKLRLRHGFVVHGTDGLDEITLSGETEIAEVKNGTVRQWRFSPEDAGLDRAPLSQLQGGDAAENAASLKAIFAGETGPRRDIVLVNAAATLLAAGMVPDIRGGIELAAAAIDSGAVFKTLAALVEFGKQAR
jgi:anthranilate phosphoribosyltransferase